MGMSTGSLSDEAAPNINVTPLIDVLLVLIIIFMVITPSKPTRFEAKVPAEPKPDEQQADIKPNPLTLVVSVNKSDSKVFLNREKELGDVSNTEPLTNELSRIFKEREQTGAFREGTNEVEKTVFIKSPRSVKYGDVVKIIDAVKLAGASPVGLQIDDLSE
jgi:biopolymer transport protein ExbD